MLMYNFTNLYIERVSRRRWWTEAYFLQVHVPSTTSGASPDTRTILKRAYFVGEPPVQMSGDAYNETMHDDRLWVQVEPERVTDYDSWLEVSSRHIPEPKGRLWNLLLIHLERDEHEVRQALSLGYHPTFAAAGSGDLIDDISWLESFTNELQPDGPTSAPLPPVEREEEPAHAADD
jgi:hypothetical protein